MFWPKLTTAKIEERVTAALDQNMGYRNNPILGIPATYLDPEIFYADAPFLEHAPFLSTLIANPNHIGCHTLNHTEKLFQGTQQLEKELVSICAEEIFEGEKNKQDGYVASGGTEGNIEALWIYRNFFQYTFQAKPNEIGVIYSQDSHYSVAKGINLLGIGSVKIPVDPVTRQLLLPELISAISQAVDNGIKYYVVVMNMSTTMFGSVDDIEAITPVLDQTGIIYKIHVDGAFGGFIYPFSNPGNSFSFKNPRITSFSIDAHKLLQTPYGTGIFLIRKGFMQYVRTNEAQYVPGTDHTLCGSRSGANAVAVWMVLHNYGSQGWNTKIRSLVDLTTDICVRLDKRGITYYRNPYMNIIAIRSSDISADVAEKFHLVADTYEGTPQWWKIVVMPHITRGAIDAFMQALENSTVKNHSALS